MSLPVHTNPDAVFPNEELKNLCYIKNVVKSPNIIIGDYTYYDDPVDSTAFEKNNVLFNWSEFGDKLIIGNFCAIASGTQFLMGSANHRMNSISTYPFNVFSQDWQEVTPPHLSQLPFKGDIVIGNDVWIGRECLIMPGVKIGNGAVIGSRSVVAKDIPPYTIAAGNPAKPVRKRFSDSFIELLEKLKWWDFKGEKLKQFLPLLCETDLEKAQKAVKEYLEKIS